MRITESTTPTTRQHHTLPWLYQVCNDFISISIAYDRTTWYAQNNILPFGPMHLLSHPMLTRASLKVVLIAIVDERVCIVCGLHIDASASAAISTIWSSIGDVFLSV